MRFSRCQIQIKFLLPFATVLAYIPEKFSSFSGQNVPAMLSIFILHNYISPAPKLSYIRMITLLLSRDPYWGLHAEGEGLQWKSYCNTTPLSRPRFCVSCSYSSHFSITPPPPCRVIHVMNSPIFSLPALMLNPHTYHTNHLTYLKPPNHHKHIIHAVAHLLTGPK